MMSALRSIAFALFQLIVTPPYAIAVLTEWEPSATGRSTTIAAASYIGYAALIGDRVDDD